MTFKFLAPRTLLAITALAFSLGATAADFNGNAQRGAALYGVCAGCHGADGAGNAATKAPRLTGQFEWYLVSQIKNFKAGIRGTAKGDTNGAVMVPMASTLANDQAIADVVAYIMTLDAPAYQFKK